MAPAFVFRTCLSEPPHIPILIARQMCTAVSCFQIFAAVAVIMLIPACKGRKEGRNEGSTEEALKRGYTCSDPYGQGGEYQGVPLRMGCFPHKEKPLGVGGK
jgi:hypothetical protein